MEEKLAPKETFVFEGTEVVKTGRSATKKVGNASDKVVEIQPAGSDVPMWKKWVRDRELYTVDKS